MINRKLLSFIIVLTILGCSNEKFVSLSTVAAPAISNNQELAIAHGRQITILSKKVKRPVKLFFIIDDSPSMEQFQVKLIENTKRWVNVIGSDFIGEVHSVTTTELEKNAGSHLNSPTYSFLEQNGSITNKIAALGINTRFHGDWTTGELWLDDNGLISISRNQFILDELTNKKLPLFPLDGKQPRYTLITQDKYQLLNTSLMGTFNGGASQKERLESTLYQAINRGATGSTIEQPYCALIHALLDSGRLNLFKPEDKVAFIFLLHGEANYVAGETCISGFEMKSKLISEGNFQVERYAAVYSGRVKEPKDENSGQFTEIGSPQMFAFDCAGSNPDPLCKASESEIAEAKAKRLKMLPLKASWDGLIGKSCDSLEESKYIAYLKQTYPEDFAGLNPRKNFVSGSCVSIRGFAPWTYNPQVKVPKEFLSYNCNNASIAPLIDNSVNAFRSKYPSHYLDKDICYLNSDSLYEIQEKQKTHFPGINDLSGPNDYASLVSKLMDEKIGRANYIVSAVTTTGTGNPLCDPDNFKANSLMELVKRSPTPNELISICEDDYTPALKRVEQFALFEAERNYTVEQLPKMGRLLRIKVKSNSGVNREIPLSLIKISEDRTSLQIDKSVEIQPDDILVFEYRNESPVASKVIVPTAGTLFPRYRITVIGSNFFPGISIKLSGIDCAVKELKSSSSLTCILQDTVSAIQETTLRNLDGGESTTSATVEVTK